MKLLKAFFTKIIILITILLLLIFAIAKISYAEIEFGITNIDTPNLENLKEITLGTPQEEARYEHLGKPFGKDDGDTTTVSEDTSSTNMDKYTYDEYNIGTIQKLYKYLNTKGDSSIGNNVLRNCSSLFCIKHGQAIAGWYAYLKTNHEGNEEISKFIGLENEEEPYEPYKPYLKDKENTKILDYLDKTNPGEPEEVRIYENVKSNVRYFKAKTDLYEIDNDFGVYKTNIFAYAATFSNKSKVLHNSGNNLAQLAMWAVVGDPAIGEPSIEEPETEKNNGNNNYDNTLIEDSTLISDSELWNAGAALDEYEAILTKNIGGTDTQKHEVAIEGTDPNLLNRPSLTINAASGSDEYVDNAQGNKVGTVQDSTGTTLQKINNKYYYKIGPFNMSDYALASAKDLQNGTNCIEKYSGKDLDVYKDMLGGIINGYIKFKNDGNGETATVKFSTNPDSGAQVVYTDMLGNPTDSTLTVIDGNYTRTPRETDEEPYVYPYPNSTFYILINKDLCGANATKMSEVGFEYRQTKAYGEGWVITSKYTQTTWEIKPENVNDEGYYCESCAHENLSRVESQWGDGTGSKKHIKYCGSTGYCGVCKEICKGHSTGKFVCDEHHSHSSWYSQYNPGCYSSVMICNGWHHYHDWNYCYDSSWNLICGYHEESTSCYTEGNRICGGKHDIEPFESKDNPGCYGCYVNTDYCSDGYKDGKHYADNHWGSAGNDYCGGTTRCDVHKHKNCYSGNWKVTQGPNAAKGQPFLAVHDAQVEVIKTEIKTTLDIRLTTDVSIKKYIYDVQHVESDTLTNSGYDSTLTPAEGMARKEQSDATKEANPVYVEYGDTVIYHIDLINKQSAGVKVRIRDILPEKAQVLSIKVGETQIPYTSVTNSFFVTGWIDVAGNSTTTTEIKILVTEWKENIAWKNTASIITKNEGHKGYPSKTVSSVDYMRVDVENAPGPVVNLAEINGGTTESSDWYTLNNYKANIDKFISAYDEKITKDNNNPNNANKMKITDEVNASSLLLNDAKKNTKEYYTRYAYSENDKLQHPLSVEKGETITYSVLISNDAVQEGYKKATQVRPSAIEDKLEVGLAVKDNVVAMLYNKDGSLNTRYDSLGTVPVSITKVGTSGGFTTYKFEIDNSVILNPGEYILFTINVIVEESNMYLFDLENKATLGRLTNINHGVGNDPVGPYDRTIKDDTKDVNYGLETSSEYVKMKDLVISGRVWLDRDKDGLMDLESDKTFEDGSIDIDEKPSSDIEYSTENAEKAMENIVVKLYQDVGKDKNDANDIVVRTTKTDKNGIYTFGRTENLEWYPGQYSITGNSGSLVTTESDQRIPKADNKDSNKNYQSNSNYIDYYIEFEYDGVLYKSTEIYAGMKNLDNKGNLTSNDYYIDSNAKEFEDEREKFNKTYEYISYDIAYAVTEGNDKQANLSDSHILEFDKDNHESYLRLDPARAMTARSFIEDNTSERITNYIWLFDFNKTLGYDIPETDYLKYINLGLEEREEVDISLIKDIYEVKTTVNGEEVSYNYNQIEAEGPNALNGEMVSDDKKYLQNYEIKEPYGLTLYESDFKYRFDDYKSADVQAHKTENSELNVEITYKISVDNKALEKDYRNSDGTYTDVKVDTRIHEIVDLYDENLKEIIFNTDGSMASGTENKTTLRIKDTQTIDDETFDTLKDKVIENCVAWYYPNNDTTKAPIYLTLTGNSKYSRRTDDFGTTDGYSKLYISGMDDVYIEEGEQLDIYVKYVVNKQGTMESNGKTLERVLQIVERTNNGYKNGDVIEGISQVNAYSVWYKDSKKPASIVDCDSNVGNIGLKDENGATTSIDNIEFYEDTVYKTGIIIDVDENGPIRELTGKVWDDSRSEVIGSEPYKQYVGNGYYNASDKNYGAKTKDDSVAKMNETLPINYKNDVTEEKDIAIRNAKAEYLEIIAIVGADGKVRYYEEQIDSTAWEGVQSARTDEEGKYTLKGYIPGYYVIRFTYGDNGDTEITNINNIETAAKDMLVFNGQDYKSTQYTGESDTLTDYNQILKRMQKDNENDARDDEIRRLETISYSEVMVNRVAEILKGITNGTDLTQNNKEKNTAAELKELIDNTKMFAETVKFYVKPEKLEKLTNESHEQFNVIKNYGGLSKNEDQILYKEVEDIEYADTSVEARKFEIHNIDFGIEYRPESQIGLNKRIATVTLIPSDNQEPLVELVFDSVGEGDDRENVINKEKSKGLENVQFISNGYTSLKSITSEAEKEQGFVFVNIDEEILQGCTLEIGYEFIGSNKSEVDRININLDDLRYKENAVALANKAFFYTDNPNNENYRGSRTAANILKSTYGTVYDLDGDVLYRTKTRKTYETDGTTEAGYYGKFLGEAYYTGEIGKKDIVSSLKFDKILDYIDTDLVFRSDENLQKHEENTLWSTTSSHELNDSGLLKTEIFTAGNRLLSPVGVAYDTFKEEIITKEDGTIETVKQPITSNLVVSVDDRIKDADEYTSTSSDPTINVDISRFLLPDEDGTVTLKAHKVISAETMTEDMSYENIAEVIQFTTSTGRRTNYATTIGNADVSPIPKDPSDPDYEKIPPGGSQEYHESTKEPDTSAVEEVTLQPPTGLTGRKKLIRNTVEVAGKGMGITAIVIAVAFGGLILVRFIIKKIKKRPIK